MTDDWRYRHAALMAVSACGEGCHAQMEHMLNNILDCVLPFLEDPVSIVGYRVNLWIWSTGKVTAM